MIAEYYTVRPTLRVFAASPEEALSLARAVARDKGFKATRLALDSDRTLVAWEIESRQREIRVKFCAKFGQATAQQLRDYDQAVCDFQMAERGNIRRNRKFRAAIRDAAAAIGVDSNSDIPSLELLTEYAAALLSDSYVTRVFIHQRVPPDHPSAAAINYWPVTH